MSIFNETLMDSLTTLVKDANPDTAERINSESFLPVNVTAVASPGSNSQVTVVGMEGGGFKGTLQLAYNRLDLGILFSAVNLERRVIRVTGTAGATVTLNSIMDEVNRTLGLGIAASATFADVVNVSFVFPAKGKRVAVALTPVAKSYRLTPTPINIMVESLGERLGDTLVGDKINIWKDGSNKLIGQVYKGAFGGLPKTKIMLHNVDFSGILSDAAYPANSESAGPIGGGYFKYSLTQGAVNSINKILLAYGMAGLPYPFFMAYSAPDNVVARLSAKNAMSVAADSSANKRFGRTFQTYYRHGYYTPYDTKGLSDLEDVYYSALLLHYNN